MALTVKTSQLPNSGKGLFTTTAIKKGTRVIEYLGEIIDWKEYEKRVERDEDGYLFFINKKSMYRRLEYTLSIKHVTQMMRQV
ncbi:MAG: SET domain-containing protein [Bacteroidetes bacterium]|nr:SET domain-containing protein [Bacteroidota bacterium]